MKEFTNFSLKEGSEVVIMLRSGNEAKSLSGTFEGLSDTFQPLLYLKGEGKNYLINMLDIIYIETKVELEKIEKKEKTDYVF